MFTVRKASYFAEKLILAVAVILLCGCVSHAENVEFSGNAAENVICASWAFIKDGTLTLKSGKTHSGYMSFSLRDKSEFSPDGIAFVSENENVATITRTRDIFGTYLYYEISAVSGGETYIYAVSADGSFTSEKLHVIVDAPPSTAGTSPKPTETAEPPSTAGTSPEPTETAEPPSTAGTSPEPTETAEPPSGITYVLNTNSKKIHYSWCSSVARIKPSNYAETDDFAAALANGYQPCKNCDPTG